jgi:hypothetical protein
MKKLLLFLFCAAMVQMASAQITKGSVLLGGGVSVGTGKTEAGLDADMKRTNVLASLSAGVATRENTVVGGSLSFGSATQKNISRNIPDVPSESKTYGAGVFIRKYLPLGRSFYLFGQGSTNFGYSEALQPAAQARITSRGWNVGLSLAPGISYALNKKFHLELGFNELAGISYSQSKNNTRSGASFASSKSSVFNLNTSIGTATPLNIGFRVLLAK